MDDFNDGSDPNGLWTLRVCDGVGGDNGTVEYLELVFGDPPACPAPSALTVSALGSNSVDLGFTSFQIGDTMKLNMTPPALHKEPELLSPVLLQALM